MSETVEPLKILLVEDELADVLLLRRALGRAELHWSLTVARDGIRALSLITAPQSKVPDLVLLDLNLTGRSGLEVLARLRRQPVWQDLPVLVLSTSSQSGDVDAAQEKGASGYLVKPDSFSEMIAMLESVEQFARKGEPLPPPPSRSSGSERRWNESFAR